MAGSFNVHRCTFCGISPVEQKGQILIALGIKERNGNVTPFFLQKFMPGAGICADCFEKVQSLMTPTQDLPDDYYCHCCGTPAREVQAFFAGNMLSVCGACLKLCEEIIEEEKRARQEKPET